MDFCEIKTGMILKDVVANCRYRVIFVGEDMVVFCEMDVERIVFEVKMFDDVVEQIAENRLISEIENPMVVDEWALSNVTRKRLETSRKVVRMIREEFGPRYIALKEGNCGSKISSIANECGVSVKTVWKYTRRYLQSGFDEIALIDKRRERRNEEKSYSKKTGRRYDGLTSGVIVDQDLKRIFDDGIKYYLSGRACSYQTAYTMICSKYFSDYVDSIDGRKVVLKAICDRPTYRQFYYYASQKISAEEKDKAKTSAREVRNNKRLLLSDNLNGVMGPWDCFEMDEVELDVSLVGIESQYQTVGRPIVYVMMDVYTRLIAGFSISYDNNSVLAMTNCFLSLAEDKVSYCAKYGLNISGNDWPTGYLPKRIRCDRGTEYRSKEAKRICQELGVTLELVPAAMGSLKGSVEQQFHMMHSAQNAHVESRGLIEKRYDSKHHDEAVLNIDDITEILLKYVVTYNQMSLPNYPLTKQMVEQKVQPIPLELFKYGVKKFGLPMNIPNMDVYRYTLMSPFSATLSRKGLCVAGLYYIDHCDKSLKRKMYALQNKKEKIDVRMDVRDVGAVYYIEGNSLKRVPLNLEKAGQEDFLGMTYREYKEFEKARKELRKLGAVNDEQLRVERFLTNESVVRQKEKTRIAQKSSTKNMAQHRKKEKEYVSNRRAQQAGMEMETELPVALEEVVVKGEQDLILETDILTALVDFEEDEY